MKILIVTQVVDEHDPVLGFFVSWIALFARSCESVEVICLRKGTYTLPPNVRVHSLGKETQTRSRLMYAARFLRLAWSLRREYNSVFVHMNPEYLVIAGLLWRMLRKRVGLWYMHKSVTRALRIGIWYANVIFTASAESFRVATPKVRIMGHGIDMRSLPRVPAPDSALRIMSLGRISESKGIREGLEALDVLASRGVSFSYTIVGSAVTSADRAYQQSLLAEVARKPYAASVHFSGPVDHAYIPRMLAQADVFLHLSETGSLDKAALEALLAGVPVVSSNDAVKKLIPRSSQVSRDDANMVASALLVARDMDMSSISARIRVEHDVTRLIPRIVEHLRPRCSVWGARFVMRGLLALRDCAALFSRSPEVSILCYHSIGLSNEETTVSPRDFESHLSMLRASGAEFVSLERVVAWQQGVGVMPRRAIAITFDDGYCDVLDTVLPILTKYAVPATVFVVGDEAAARSRLGNDIPLMSSDDIISVQSHKLISIGYHALSHANPLDPTTNAHAECVPRYGATVFAYPGGKYSDTYIQVLRTLGYSAACSIKPELVQQGTNPFLLPRSVILASTPRWQVRYYTTHATTWYRRARRILRG